MEDDQEPQAKEEENEKEHKDDIRDLVNNALDTIQNNSAQVTPQKDPSIKLPEEIEQPKDTAQSKIVEQETKANVKQTSDIGKISQEDKIEDDQTAAHQKEDIAEEKPLSNETEEMTKMA